jgi:hypothetical protein
LLRITVYKKKVDALKQWVLISFLTFN